MVVRMPCDFEQPLEQQELGIQILPGRSIVDDRDVTQRRIAARARASRR